jgi:hypothetical protein
MTRKLCEEVVTVSDVSLGEVTRRVVSLEGVVGKHSDRLDKVEAQTTVNTNNISNIDRRLEKIDGNVTWLLRLIIGTIVVAVIGFILKGGFSV